MNVALSTSGGTLNLSGSVVVTATPNKAGVVKSVDFYVDGVLKATDASSPFSFTWNTALATPGTHQLRADAFYDNRQLSQAKLTVTVLDQQTGPPPPPPIQAVPVNTTPPMISGTAKEGQVLTALAGSWTNSPTSFTYQWLRCDASGANGVAIPSATGSTYTVLADSVGSTIRCAVTAHNSIGASAVVQTAQTAVVTALTPAVPTNTSLPVVSGTPVQFGTLSISNGGWVGSPTSYTYQWKRCDAAGANAVSIAGATAATYALASADIGATIRCAVVAINATGASAPALSAATAVVTQAGGVPVLVAAPAISGSVVQGSQLAISLGTWTNGPTSYTHQWSRCDPGGANPLPISGATGTTYITQAADVGRSITCWTTAFNTYGGSTPVRSAATAVITATPTSGGDFTGWDISLYAPFTVQRMIVCTTNAQFWAAWADLRPGDYVDVRGVAFVGQTEFSGKNLIGWAEIHFDSACTFRHTSQYFAAWVHNVSYLRFYGGDISNSGWDGMRIEQVDHFTWWGFKSHDNAGHGVGMWESATTGRTTNNVSLRGETYRNGLNYPVVDGHSEKGTGLHGCYLGSSNGWLEDFEVYLLVHDQPTGAAIENGPNTRRGKIQLDARRITFEAQSQVGGVALSFWDGGTGPGPSQTVVVEYLYAEDCAGRAVEVSDGLAGSATPGFTIRKARHLRTNYAITPGSVSPTDPYRDTSGSVVYQDCT